ncbi:hypothetical protein EG346_16375 [Chryseobacterium carnipullorum]|uniref:Uncharacterized protein n=1 Tax=Chryseobacterium carnipullorum TaxID=1124835 RepID=A0A376DTY5_CHRCU|nr:DUF6261 family protein [Chryseobacterium carnipullorum]AZA49658.1 hypothetical protein EG346_16375 [Chryseobacterium carnipullorum]AZA64551.1 hypothetical protein EG345_07395 [Chryseobacterium carnipullorum]STC95150.1 Uncharacterised protein [Chryseobacterium carnipullorum]
MKIALTKLSTKDLATLAQRTISNAQSGKYPVIANHPLLADLLASYTEYDRVYTKQVYSGKGKDVAALDHERDVAYNSMKAFLNGYRKLSSAANYQLAEDLYRVFKTFGLDLDRRSYSSQTAQMKKLIETLESSENMHKIRTLALETALADMKAKHEAFETLFSEQAGINADLRQMKSASAIRKDLEKNLKTYISLLTVMKNVPGWELFYNDVNELVKAAKNSSVLNPKQEKPS